MVHWQDFMVAGDRLRLGGYQLPISEGIVDRRFVGVGLALLRHAMTSHPYWFTVGMGGIDRPLPRLLRASGWHVRLAPLLFRVHRAGPVLRHVTPLRATRARRMVRAVLACSGLGRLAVYVHRRCAIRSPGRSWSMDVATGFESWADAIWDDAKGAYSLCAVRDAQALGQSYPPQDERYRCIRVHRDGVPRGWAVVSLLQTSRSRYFGDLRLGVILDCFGDREAAPAVAFHAARALDESGADLIVTNQTATFWVEAFRRCGFLNGPSNYGVTLSKPVVEHLEKADAWETAIHVTRGDGDGRVNILRDAVPAWALA